jgi:hypothetical protein
MQELSETAWKSCLKSTLGPDRDRKVPSDRTKRNGVEELLEKYPRTGPDSDRTGEVPSDRTGEVPSDRTGESTLGPDRSRDRKYPRTAEKYPRTGPEKVP